jgi:hypothetical protein
MPQGFVTYTSFATLPNGRQIKGKHTTGPVNTDLSEDEMRKFLIKELKKGDLYHKVKEEDIEIKVAGDTATERTGMSQLGAILASGPALVKESAAAKKADK